MVAHNREFFDPLDDPAPKPKYSQFGDAPPVSGEVKVSGDVKEMLGGLYHELVCHTDHTIVIRAKSDFAPEGIGAREIFCTDCDKVIFGMVAV